MNKQIVKLALLVAVTGGMAMTADAQRRGRNRNQPATTTPDTASQQVNNVNRQPTGYNPYGNVPIEAAPVSGGFTDSTKPSLRNDAAYEKLGMKDRTPLVYDHLR